MTPSRLPRILFIHNALTTFVRHDRDLLRAAYAVTECQVSPRRPRSWLSLPRLIKNHDLIFGWFASAHTLPPLLLARLWQKPSLLVIGGYDVANMPEISYGHQRGGLKKIISRLAIHQATMLVTNSQYSAAEIHQNIGRLPNLNVIYHGVPDPFAALPAKPERPLILTVGNVDQPNRWRKGHEPFIRAAALLPDLEFVLVGRWKDDAIDHLRALATPNVTFTGRVADDVLLDYYRRAAVYVQASAHEGFGLSVAEAMLAGCLPVATRAGALPEVIGNTGILLAEASPQALSAAIRQALALPSARHAAARQRILHHFPLSQRQALLMNCIARLLAPNKVPSVSPKKDVS